MDDFEEFAIDALDSNDTGTMTVTVNGRLTKWVWTFAGPGHAATIEQNNRLTRERLHREALQEQAQVNGKKWKAPEETVDEIRQRNVGLVVGRLLGWSPVKFGGEVLEYSPDAARKLLLDPKKQELLTQAFEFLAADTAFTKRSAGS